MSDDKKQSAADAALALSKRDQLWAELNELKAKHAVLMIATGLTPPSKWGAVEWCNVQRCIEYVAAETMCVAARAAGDLPPSEEDARVRTLEADLRRAVEDRAKLVAAVGRAVEWFESTDDEDTSAVEELQQTLADVIGQ